MAHNKTYLVADDMCFVDSSEVTASIMDRVEAIERTVFKYDYPDIDLDGRVSITDTLGMRDYVAEAGAGNYSKDKYGWKQFALDNNLNEKIYPDYDFDGVVTAGDVAIVEVFSADAGAGNYTNDRAGWNEYMKKLYPDPTPTPSSSFDPVGVMEVLES